MPTPPLSGRTALVTGASSGIGRHLAGTLGRNGARVVLAARRAGRLEALEAALGRDGIEAAAVTLDVTDPGSVADGIAAAEAAFGGIDILINNAGMAAPQPFLEMSEDAFSTVLDTNLAGVFRVGQRVARGMVERGGGGAIVNIASALGHMAQKSQANYAAAKAGVAHLTRVMALELARAGVRVNALAPGYFETEINADFFASEKGQAYIRRLFPRRLGRLEELDGPVLLLVSDAGSFVNGAVIPVDGGTSLTGL